MNPGVFWTTVSAVLVTILNLHLVAKWTRAREDARAWYEWGRKLRSENGDRSPWKWGARHASMEAYQRVHKQLERARRNSDARAHRCEWRSRLEAADQSIEYLRDSFAPDDAS